MYQTYNEIYRSLPQTLIIFIITHFIKTIILINTDQYFKHEEEFIPVIVIRIIFEIIVVAIIVLFKNISNNFLAFKIFNYLFLIVSCVFPLFFAYFFLNDNELLVLEYLEQAMIINIVINFSVLQFVEVLVFNLIIFIFWFVYFIISENYINILFAAVLQISEICRNYSYWNLFIQNFNSIQALSMKTIEKNNLLTNLLPSHIITKFFQQQKKRLEFYEELKEVTILFADIAGFTKFSNNKNPEEVVNMLRKLFTQFD